MKTLHPTAAEVHSLLTELAKHQTAGVAVISTKIPGAIARLYKTDKPDVFTLEVSNQTDGLTYPKSVPAMEVEVQADEFGDFPVKARPSGIRWIGMTNTQVVATKIWLDRLVPECQKELARCQAAQSAGLRGMAIA